MPKYPLKIALLFFLNSNIDEEEVLNWNQIPVELTFTIKIRSRRDVINQQFTIFQTDPCQPMIKVFLNWDSLFVQVKQISTEKLLLMMFFQFVRRLKLREFFSDKNTKDTSENISQKITKRNEDRSALGWTIKNPHWYPDAVRKGKSVRLVNFIENSLHDFRQH